jgi:hypothetical protein
MVSNMKHAQTMLAIKPEGKNQFGTSNRGWEYNIKKNMVIWVGLIWLRVGARDAFL